MTRLTPGAFQVELAVRYHSEHVDLVIGVGDLALPQRVCVARVAEWRRAISVRPCAPQRLRPAGTGHDILGLECLLIKYRCLLRLLHYQGK